MFCLCYCNDEVSSIDRESVIKDITMLKSIALASIHLVFSSFSTFSCGELISIRFAITAMQLYIPLFWKSSAGDTIVPSNTQF